MSAPALQGRRAVVTGASRGLGRAIAVSLAKSGAALALLGRDKEQLELTASQTRALGVESKCFTGDLTDPAQIARLEREVMQQMGGVDILINNAGAVVRKNLLDTELEEWHQVMNTNLTSVFLLCKAFVPHMTGKGYGRIINVASIFSHVSFPGRSAYSASKAGVLAMSKGLALELAPEGITVVCISPGPTMTEMTLPMLSTPELARTYTSRVPLDRWGKAEDVGELAAFLCSDNASFITGTDILIDGGWCAQ